MKESIDRNAGDEKNSAENSSVACTKVKIVLEIKRRDTRYERIVSSLLRLVLVIFLGICGYRLIDKMPNVEATTSRPLESSSSCPCRLHFSLEVRRLMSGDEKMSPQSLYDGLWERRSLEINLLWTRLTMLGTFMALTYTGYGVLLMKIGDAMPSWSVFNLLAIGMGCFGILFSTLWTLMAKGSKAWFELYEAAIENFQKNSRVFADLPDGTKLIDFLNLKSRAIERLREPVDSDLFSPLAGRFSVSKIPIVMGQMSLMGWIVVVALHFCCLLLGEAYVRQMVEWLGVGIAVLAVLAVSLGVSVSCHRSWSGFL